MKYLGLGDLDLTGINGITKILGVLAIDGASDGEGSSENLLDGTRELAGKGLGAHDAGDLNDIIERDVAVVLDVLLLLAVTGSLLEGLDDQGRGRGDDRDGSLTVLDGQLNGDTETLPVLGGLGNIFTDLLGRKTERTNLGGKSRGSSDLSSGGTEVDDLDLVGVQLCFPTNLCTYSYLIFSTNSLNKICFCYYMLIFLDPSNDIFRPLLSVARSQSPIVAKVVVPFPNNNISQLAGVHS